MRLFVTEFITGGGIANHPLPESLKQEGQLMLQAVLNDCAKMNDVQLVTTQDKRISINIDDVEIHIVESDIDYMQQLILIAQQCDATWVIAPESENILETIITQLTNEKVTLINCDSQSIHVVADKLACAEYLIEHNINTVRNLTLEEAAVFDGPVIIKDRYGVGCEGLMWHGSGELALKHVEDFSQYVVQPYVEGEHLSVSISFSNQHAMVLSVNQQIISWHDIQPQLKSCFVNAYSATQEIQELADNVHQALPGLKGYVGVDIIKAEDDYYVVDINPRLTSSYVGLSNVLENNPAELCINSVLDPDFLCRTNKSNKIVEVHIA